MNKFFSVMVLTLTLVLLSLSSCSADQPPATAQDVAEASSEAALAVDEAAAKAADAVADVLPTEVAASDEEMPAEDELVLAQADAQTEGQEEGQPAQSEKSESAKPAPFRLGDHYTMLTPAQTTSSAPGKIEVVEAFMYGCPHCFTFEPFIEKWLPGKASYIEFTRLPALFNRPAKIHARAFYTAETLGVLDQTHMAFFREVHVNRKSMTDDDEIAAFFERFGVDESTFRETFNSFAVDTKLRRAESLNRRYRLSSTPTVIINGKYVTNGDKITSYDQYLEMADYLAAKEAGRE